ncbi:hypothetical protein D7Z54_29915 [Salibacterium salarium]|uniref:Uncharacterized protein n=2 Tax=Salibacterium salarium TaxID=284579 RepID=A0A3R9PYD0_9BACI|nr:hypothetical protein D7Z54_29915 [Salibacterium salarium]
MKSNVIEADEIFRDRQRHTAIGYLPDNEKQMYDFFINSNIEFNQEKPPFQKVAEYYEVTLENAKEKILEIEGKIEEIIMKLTVSEH